MEDGGPRWCLVRSNGESSPTHGAASLKVIIGLVLRTLWRAASLCCFPTVAKALSKATMQSSVVYETSQNLIYRRSQIHHGVASRETYTAPNADLSASRWAQKIAPSSPPGLVLLRQETAVLYESKCQIGGTKRDVPVFHKSQHARAPRSMGSTHVHTLHTHTSKLRAMRDQHWQDQKETLDSSLTLLAFWPVAGIGGPASRERSRLLRVSMPFSFAKHHRQRGLPSAGGTR